MNGSDFQAFGALAALLEGLPKALAIAGCLIVVLGGSVGALIGIAIALCFKS